MKELKYFILLVSIQISVSCTDFLNLQPEYRINENSFYKNANDFETALIGNYAGLQDIHDATILYLAELSSDNAQITWTSPTVAETECDEVNITPSNGFINSIWNSGFTIISRSNNILAKLNIADIDQNLKNQFIGEALFLRAYSYFYLVRLFGELPIVEVAFRGPEEIASFDMTRQPLDAVYDFIIQDLESASDKLQNVTGLSKSRASFGAAETLLGKVYLTLKDYENASLALVKIINLNIYSLQPSYKTLFTNGNDELIESIFEIKYLSGNVGEGNGYSSIFMPPRFDMAEFPGDMQGSGRIVPTADVRSVYESGDIRKEVSIGDSVKLKDGSYAQDSHGLKFVDFTTGITGDGGINFTALRYADVLLMYAETLSKTGSHNQAYEFINMVRTRAGLDLLNNLSEDGFALAVEHERRVEFLLEGQRWFNLIRTGRAKEVMNDYFKENGLSFTLEDYELLMPIPQSEIDIDPDLVQNPGY